jgi:hypothetical protein
MIQIMEILFSKDRSGPVQSLAEFDTQCQRHQFAPGASRRQVKAPSNDHAAVRYGVAQAPRGYTAQWFAFELKFGPYSPDIDSSPGLTGQPLRLLDLPQRREEWALSLLADYLDNENRARDLHQAGLSRVGDSGRPHRRGPGTGSRRQLLAAHHGELDAQGLYLAHVPHSVG